MDTPSDIIGIGQETPTLENLIARLEVIHSKFPIVTIVKIIRTIKQIEKEYITAEDKKVLQEAVLLLNQFVIGLEAKAKEKNSISELRKQIVTSANMLLTQRVLHNAMLDTIQQATGKPPTQFVDLR